MTAVTAGMERRRPGTCFGDNAACPRAARGSAWCVRLSPVCQSSPALAPTLPAERPSSSSLGPCLPSCWWGPTGSRRALVGVPVPAECSLGWLFAEEVGDVGRDEGAWPNSGNGDGSSGPITRRGPQWICGEGRWWSGLSPSLAAAFPHPACRSCGLQRALPCPS